MLTVLKILVLTWNEFWQETSIAGAANAGKAKGLIRRAIWVLIFVGGACLTINSIHNVIWEYRMYRVNTEITMKRQEIVSYHKEYKKSTT